jgi:hypothetical protein
MKRLLITLTILLLATMAAAQTPYWLTAINAIGRPGDSASISSVVYADGYIAYHYRQTMRWGEREIFSPNFNVVLARVADDGSADWLVDIGGTSSDMVSDITTDADGYVYIVGTTYSPTIEIDGQKIVKAGSTSTSDIFVGKFDPDGRCVWITALGGTNMDVGSGITVDAKGHVYVVGSVTGFYADTPRWSSADGYLAKLDPDGKLLWHRRMGSYGYDGLQGVAVDDEDRVYAGGAIGPYNRGYFYVGGQTYTTYSPYQQGAFVVAYDAEGGHLWTQKLGGLGMSNVLKVDKADNDILVGGYFSNSARFGEIPLTSVSKSMDTFVLRMNPDGVVLWAKKLGGGKTDQLRDMICDGKAVTVSAATDRRNTATTIYGTATWWTLDARNGYTMKTFKIPGKNQVDAWGVGYDEQGVTYVGLFAGALTVNDVTIKSPEYWSIFIYRQYR